MEITLEHIAGKRCLVTGATGFVGQHLTEKLCSLGAKVTVLVRSTASRDIVVRLKNLGATVVEGDITSPEDVSEAGKGQEIIFHIAALFRQAKFPDKIYSEVNVGGVENVLAAAKEHSVARVVHCSTVGVHSHIPKPPADEHEEYRPGDIYQETKCAGEKVARKAFESGEVPGVVVRPAMIWGEGDKRMLKLFKGVAKRKFPIIGDGKTLTHWVYVHDLVKGFILAALSPKALGKVYILAGERPASIEELVTTVAKKAGVNPLPFKVPAVPVQIAGSLTEVFCKPLGVEPPLYRRRVDFFTKDRSFDISRAKSDLGYKPSQSFEQEVSNIYDWYQSSGWLSE